MEHLFKNKKLNIYKLKNYGFIDSGSEYIYKTNVLSDSFELAVNVSSDGFVKTRLLDLETGEPYTLHLSEAEGSFVGKVREEFNAVLAEIADRCYDVSVFRFEQSYKIIDYVRKKYGDEVEYLWEKFPDNAVARRKDNKKWYLAILTVKRSKLGIAGDGDVEVLDVRVKADSVECLLGRKGIYPAYHMNKKHWITILLDGSLEFGEIKKYIDESYVLALKR